MVCYFVESLKLALQFSSKKHYTVIIVVKATNAFMLYLSGIKFSRHLDLDAMYYVGYSGLVITTNMLCCAQA